MQDSKTTLADVIGDSYTPEQYLSDGEIDLIKRTFKGNDALIKVLRKIFMTTAMDPELPIENMGQDCWMVDRDFAQMSEKEIKSIVLARQDTIKFVLGGLVKLKILAYTEDVPTEERKKRREKDSSK